jgi:hypothetical protein
MWSQRDVLIRQFLHFYLPVFILAVLICLIIENTHLFVAKIDQALYSMGILSSIHPSSQHTLNISQVKPFWSAVENFTPFSCSDDSNMTRVATYVHSNAHELSESLSSSSSLTSILSLTATATTSTSSTSSSSSTTTSSTSSSLSMFPQILLNETNRFVAWFLVSLGAIESPDRGLSMVTDLYCKHLDQYVSLHFLSSVWVNVKYIISFPYALAENYFHYYRWNRQPLVPNTNANDMTATRKNNNHSQQADVNHQNHVNVLNATSNANIVDNDETVSSSNQSSSIDTNTATPASASNNASTSSHAFRPTNEWFFVPDIISIMWLASHVQMMVVFVSDRLKVAERRCLDSRLRMFYVQLYAFFVFSMWFYVFGFLRFQLFTALIVRFPIMYFLLHVPASVVDLLQEARASNPLIEAMHYLVLTLYFAAATVVIYIFHRSQYMVQTLQDNQMSQRRTTVYRDYFCFSCSMGMCVDSHNVSHAINDSKIISQSGVRQ